jgi:hypothetical protein
MALGNKDSARTPIIYAQLSRSEDYGFKRTIKTINPADGAPQNHIESYDHVTGIPAGFYIREEPTFEVVKALRAAGTDPRTVKIETLKDHEIKHVATLMLKDPETGEMIGINFDLHDSLGGKIVGMLNAARMSDSLGQDFNLRTFYSAPHTKYNDSDKGISSINMRPNGSANKEDDIKPVFLDDAGAPLMDATQPGGYARLPMGTVAAEIKGKKHWEFSARNVVITNTSFALLEHFKKPAHAPEDEGVDLSEAAKAAAPSA